MAYRVTVTLTGPVFDGRAKAITREFCRELETVVAGQALADAMGVMNASFRHPTPYYETQIISQRQGDWMVVHDRGIVYGPWLETGATRRPTSFRGYHSFRRATQSVVSKIQRLAQHTLFRYLTRMNGP